MEFITLHFKQEISSDQLLGAHNILLGSTGKAALGISTHSSLDLTEEFKNWEKLRGIEVNKLSFSSRQLPSFPHGMSQTLSSSASPKIGFEGSWHKLIRNGRWRPGMKQMQPEDKVLEGRGKQAPISVFLEATGSDGTHESEQTAISLFL